MMKSPLIDSNPSRATLPDNAGVSRSDAQTQERPAPPKGRPWILWLLVLAFVAGAIFVGVRRMAAEKQTEKVTAAAAVPSVTVLRPEESKADIDLVLPGNVEPFVDTPIFARTSGYVKKWFTDIGAPVQEGQLLAEIDSPEVDQELQQAQAAAATALANRQLAEVTAARWQQMLKSKTVSQQETDEKVSQLAAAQAQENSANANVRRLQELKDFEKIVAPFDGRITERKVDVGDLITAGSNGNETELFRIAQDDVLRVFVNIPEVNAQQVTLGQKASVELASAPRHPAEGKIVHLAGAIDPATRTLLAEIQVDNHGHRLLAGGYATVHVPIHFDHPAMIVPVNTLLFRPGGTTVGVVGSDGKVKLKTVEIGRDFGTSVEIKSGLDANDSVILNPSDSLSDGDEVQMAKSPTQ